MNYFPLLLAASCLAADPSFEVRKSHMRALFEQADYTSALTEARSLNRQWPDDIETYQIMAAAHLELGNYQKADETLQWMLDLRIGKADLNGYWLLARFREVTGDSEGAIEAMNLAFARLQNGEKADRSRMLTYLAHLHIAVGKIALASKILKECDGTNAETMFVRSRLLLAQSKKEEAIMVLRQLSVKQAHPRYLYALGQATGEATDYAAFERAARKISGLPDHTNPELALYLAGPGERPAEALEIARRESSKRRDIFTLNALACSLAANGDQEEARKIMKEVLAMGTQDSAILAQAARLGLTPE